MKVRQSFVTNSSSSSFVIAIDELPNNKEELAKMLFTEEQLKSGYWINCYNEAVSCSDTASFIWDKITIKDENFINDINFTNIASTFLFAHAIEGYEYDNKYPELEDYCIDKQKLIFDHDKYYMDCDDYIYKFAKDYMYKNLGKYIFHFELEDHNGFVESAIEQSGCFDKIDPNYIKINNH
jgi:hypothetical protein